MAYTMRLAWRNLFRNKRRTVIAGIAIGVGLASLIFTDALMQGMKTAMFRSATRPYLGEGQIHRRGFRLTQDVNLTIADPDGVTSALAKDPEVAAFAPRAVSIGMVTSPENVSSVMVVGVDPAKEARLSEVDDHIRQGSFFAGGEPRDAVIGRKLAEILDVALGDRIVVTVSQARTGDLAQDLFRVAGIYEFGIREMDAGFVFVRLAKAQEMLGIGDGLHEIALELRSVTQAMAKGNPFWARYSTGGNEAASWAVLLPQIEGVMGMVWVSLLFMAVVLFGIVAFGIINTLFMSLYERMFEFGVLRAVGTRAGGVRRLIVFEAGALAVIASFMGAVLGLVLTLVVAKVGIDYRGIEFAGTTFDSLIFPVLRIRQFVVYPLAVLVFTLLVGLYPARVAGKMRIAEALRKSL
jgi:ABC-type lipoprotein release transport system permease subunit